MHENDIIHRDIKPANIYLHYVNDENTIKIGDFGVAILLYETIKAKTYIGTPAFIAPEIIK